MGVNHHVNEAAEMVEGVDIPELKSILTAVHERHGEQREFLQALRGVAKSVQPVLRRRPELLPAFEMLADPERVILFRVPWLDDSGVWRVNRGYRIQFSTVLGPGKGGLRFHPSVNLSIMKFLAYEQVLKNALTTLPLGGAKGGSDFDPKGKSDGEIMRFCQSFMTGLYRDIGEGVDVPGGDIGVGSKEIGWLFGQYRRLSGIASGGVMTGKAPGWGGSQIRPEATGYGVVLFAEQLLADAGESLEGKRCVLSGAGNVAQHCAELLIQKGARVVSLSDSRGYVVDEEAGLSAEYVAAVMAAKAGRGSLESVSRAPTTSYTPSTSSADVWRGAAAADIAIPCATQNELDELDAGELVSRGVRFVLEGANMPCTEAAHAVFAEQGVSFIPGKAANAGGVAVSGLEMAQGAARLAPWTRQRVLAELQRIMTDIHDAVAAAAREYDVDLATAPDIAGFIKVAEAVIQQGTA